MRQRLKRDAHHGAADAEHLRDLLLGQGSNGPLRLTLHLFHDDMRRLGSVLADRFCTSLSGGEQYFEEEAGTARIAEAPRVA